MVNYPSVLCRFRSAFNKWRLALLILMAVYAGFILIGLSTAAFRWDESTHLNSGLFLVHGQFSQFMKTNAFYPPLFNVATAGFFEVFGISLFSARLVSLTFSMLTLWVVFEFANKLYGAKTALLSSIFLALMPGYFWLSRMAMIEVMLTFFFVLSLMLFFSWLQNRQDKYLVLSGFALGLGFLTKYQVAIAGAVMIFSILFLARGQFKQRFSKFTLLIVAVAGFAFVWMFIAYQTYASDLFNQWIYALEIGNPGKMLYADRFFTPIFYLVDMTWPYGHIHPISILLYFVSLAGLGFFVWRRKPQDKFLLIWFVVVYIFFTLIPNKEWRYVIPLFPVLAISSACLILFSYNRLFDALRSGFSLDRKRKFQIAAALLTVFLAVGAALSVYDGYCIAENDQFTVENQQAAQYLYNHLLPNESVVVVCANNIFSQDMIQFYLWMDGTKHNEVWQYPKDPADSYTPNFDINAFISLCKEHNTKYVLTYLLGRETYFNSTLTSQQVATQMYESGNFSAWSEDLTFGVNPRLISIYEFLG
jgi:4-amino-4-deoxy-L-arabinose transferase-like glycosyltransferase